ncbi:MAG: hypothetical protein RTU92_04755 [Candidatus Thorarchaeota archaeon]
MTGQIPDEFRYEGEVYALAGIDGTGLPSPATFSLEPFSTCTACWRGYMMRFDCTDNELILWGMDINLNEASPINGVEPIGPVDYPGKLFTHRYENIGYKTQFTGRIMLAKDFIDEMYVHMGFQRAMAYLTIIEIEVKEGDIVSVEDLSDFMAKERERDPNERARPQSQSKPDIDDWIEGTFSQDYDSERPQQ